MNNRRHDDCRRFNVGPIIGVLVVTISAIATAILTGVLLGKAIATYLGLDTGF